MGMRLLDKVAAITGAARGQGEAEARIFASEGACVIVADVLDELGEAIAARIRASGGVATYRHLDVASEDDWASLIAMARRDHGRLDVLVNNAGIPFRNTLSKTDLTDWDRVIRINLTGPFLGMRASVPLMRESGGGSIVNISSATGLIGSPGAAYSSSKWGLRGLTKSAALEFAQWNIRVNSVHPGIIDTPMNRSDPIIREVMEKATPLQRAGEPEDVAKLVLFLASDESQFITGVEVAIDGGLTNLATYTMIGQTIGARKSEA